MVIKQFLKPDWRKIMIFIMLSYFVGVTMEIPLDWQIPGGGGMLPSGVLVDSAPIVKPRNLIFNLIFWYFISCLIFWIYDKIKNKSFQNRLYNYPMVQPDKNRQGGFSEKSLNPELSFKSKTIKGTYETEITKDRETIHGLSLDTVNSTKELMEKEGLKKAFWQIDLAKKILDESTKENPHITDEELQQKIKSELVQEKINRNESQSGNDDIRVSINRENGNMKINISEKGTNINIINKKGLF
jgi:hypothetical protein